jgi:biopolymer transport protein ExbD
MEPFLIQTKKRGGFELNVVPLIDVVFVLLIFTIMTSSLTKETGVTVDKPQAQSAGELNRQSILVGITRDGTIHVNDRQVDLESLQDVLRRMLAENALGEIVLVADRESNTGLLVSVMDASNLAGAKKISVAAMSQ